jgi:hypothetical protein
MKADEVAERLADNIRQAVKDEVAGQLKPIKDTMLDLIDRVVDLERNSRDGQKRAEAPGVPGLPEVVQEPVVEGRTGPCEEEYQGSTGGGLPS